MSQETTVERPEKAQIESEAAIFWSKIADFLPKSMERAALGDEKIFRAFMAVYPDIRSFLLQAHTDRVVEAMEKKRISDMTIKSYDETNGRADAMEKGSLIGFNRAIDTSIQIVKNTK